MKKISIIMDCLFGIAWIGLGVLALTGYTMPPVTVLCGFGIAGLHYIWDAIDESRKSKS